jgi:hypothetical protein
MPCAYGKTTYHQDRVVGGDDGTGDAIDGHNGGA